MSEARLVAAESSAPDTRSSEAPPPQRSFVENFLNRFFHEQNIKWMLMIGAAIVFGSSLMLVTRNWAQWGNTLKYCSIFGYTVAIFCGR